MVMLMLSIIAAVNVTKMPGEDTVIRVPLSMVEG